MANIKLKNSSVSGKVPLTSDLAYGEIALNYADGKLFFKNSSNAIDYFITTTFADGTANAIPYLNASKVLTTGSGLTFNGTDTVTVGSGANILTFGIAGGYNAVVGGGSSGGLALYDKTQQAVAYSNLVAYHNFSLKVQDTTASTSTTTGALTVAGGAGIAGKLNVGGPLAVNNFLVLDSLGATGLYGGTATRYTVFGNATGSASILFYGHTHETQAQNAEIRAGNAIRMKFDFSGNIGIANTTPTTLLSIGAGAGSGGYGGGVYLNRGSSVYNFYEASDGTNSVIFGLDHTLSAAKIGTINSYPVALYTGNAERVRIDTSGNFIIGAPSARASSKLDIRGDIMTLGSNGSYYATIDYNAGTGFLSLASESGGGIIFKSGTTERVRITAAGGVAFNGATNYGTAGQILQSNGDAPPTWVTSTATGSYLPLSGGTLTGAVIVNANEGISAKYETTDQTWLRGWGIESNRTNTYLRPTVNNTQTLQIGSAPNTLSWATIRLDAASLLANGNQVLDAGNYNSYALPLTGGTMTGNITVSSTSVGAQFGNLSIGYGGVYNTIQTKDGTSELHLQYNSTGNIFLGVGGGYTTINQSTRSPIYYDSNNTAYYGDFASTSNIYNLVIKGVIGDGTAPLQLTPVSSSGAFQWASTAISSSLGSGQTMLQILGNALSQGNSGYLGFNYTGANSGSNYVSLGFYANDNILRVYNNTYTQSLGSMRAPIFYDSNNTSYYCDPNSMSNIYDLQITGSGHKYLFINPGNGWEAMVRYNGGSGSTWYVGKRTTGQTVSTNDFHFYSEAAGKTVAGIDTGGNMILTGSLSAISKSFVIDHPTKPGMKLRYGSLEGPENGVYVRGRLRGNTIELPEYWTKLVDPDSITVNLTAVGKPQDLYVEDIVDNVVYVAGENVNCFYTVYAERVDVAKLEVEIF